MPNNRSITQAQFNFLLSWLDPDPSRAGEKYEAIRRKLITFFTARRCLQAEELADETINRVALKAHEVAPGYVGNPSLYFYGVARKVFHEWARVERTPPPPVQ